MAEAAMATDTTQVPGILAENVETEVQSVPGAMEIQDSENITAIRPEHITDERDAEIKTEVDRIVEAIMANPSDIEITSELYGLGADAEAANTDNISLADQKIGPVMAELGGNSLLGKNLTEIKAKLDLVNPSVVGQEKVEFTDSVTKPRMWGLLSDRVVNEVVTRLPAGNVEIMSVINKRRDSIAETIDTLKGHLWEERDKALKNATQLALIANRLADAQDDLEEAAYTGQLIWQALNEARANETDPVRVQALKFLVNDLGVKVVDLQTVNQLNMQSRMGSETLINNCRGIQTLVGRVSNRLLPAVKTALMVKAASQQQLELAQMSAAIGDAAGKTMADTAEQVGEASVQIARLNAEALVQIEELERAFEAYEKADAEITEITEQAEKNARAISNRLGVLNQRTKTSVDPKTAARRAKEAAGV